MSADLHAPAGDMAKLNCKQLLACVGACTTTTCVATCAAAASSTATTKATTLAGCIGGVCGTADGGSGACTSPTDSSQGCQVCEGGAVQGPCATDYAACQNDM